MQNAKNPPQPLDVFHGFGCNSFPLSHQQPSASAWIACFFVWHLRWIALVFPKQEAGFLRIARRRCSIFCISNLPRQNRQTTETAGSLSAIVALIRGNEIFLGRRKRVGG
ncbi:MAG: hypothetical protein WCH99_12050 [Verrucomicrobiota bacterium]